MEGVTEQGDEYKPPLTDEQFRRLQPRLKALARRLTDKAADWDDMVQEAGLRLVMHTNWINPIVPAHSAMMDYLRHANLSHTKATSFQECEGGVRVYDDEPAGLDALIASEMYDFRHLPIRPLDKEVARLHFVDGLTQQETADRVGVSQMEVSNMLVRVRTAFKKKWLTETGDE